MIARTRLARCALLMALLLPAFARGETNAVNGAPSPSMGTPIMLNTATNTSCRPAADASCRLKVETTPAAAGVQAINLPTNALLPDRVERVVERLLRSCPGMTIHLNFSLDGLGEKHDRFRGVPGSFATTVECLDRIERRFGDHPKLLRNVASVKFDVDDVVWTAGAVSIVARYAVIYDDTHATDALVCWALLDNSPANVTATTGNTLTVAIHANGVFAITGM